LDKKKVIIITAGAVLLVAAIIIFGSIFASRQPDNESPAQPQTSFEQPNTYTEPLTDPITTAPPVTQPPAPAAPAFPIDGGETLFSFANNLPDKSQLPTGCFYVVEYWFPNREYPIKAYRYLGYDPPDIDYSQARGAWWIMSSPTVARGYNQQWRDGRLADGNTPILQDNLG